MSTSRIVQTSVQQYNKTTVMTIFNHQLLMTSISHWEPEHPPDKHLVDGLSFQHLQPLMPPSSTPAPLIVSWCLHVHSGLVGANLYPPEQNQRKAKSSKVLNIQHKQIYEKKIHLKLCWNKSMLSDFLIKVNFCQIHNTLLEKQCKKALKFNPCMYNCFYKKWIVSCAWICTSL